MEYRGYVITLLEEKGYLIEGKGTRVLQDTYIPYPAETIEQSAQNHIDQIIIDNEPHEAPLSEIEQLRQQLAETQDALIELAEIVAGGAN